MKKKVTQKSSPIGVGKKKSTKHTKKTISKKELADFVIDYKKIFKKIPSAVIVHENGSAINVSDAFAKIFGYKYTDLINKSALDLVAPESLSLAKKHIKENYSKPYKIIALRSDGSKFPIELSIVTYNDNGKNIRIVNCRDITQEEKEKEKLKESEKKFRDIFEQFQDLYYQTDMKGIVITASPSVKALAGYSPEEIIGKSVFMFYKNPSDRENFLKQIMKTGRVENYKLELIKKNRKTVIVSINSHIVFDKNKKPVRIEGTIRDISQNKKSEENLKEKMEELEKLNKLMVGRELKMIELKNELNKLKNKNEDKK